MYNIIFDLYMKTMFTGRYISLISNTVDSIRPYVATNVNILKKA